MLFVKTDNMARVLLCLVFLNLVVFIVSFSHGQENSANRTSGFTKDIPRNEKHTDVINPALVIRTNKTLNSEAVNGQEKSDNLNNKDSKPLENNIPKVEKEHKAVNNSSKEHSSEVNAQTKSSVSPSGEIFNVPQKPAGRVVESGALVRGFYVFGGLSLVIIAYFVFRSYRLRHGSEPSRVVRKYGITARRSDLEMRRLEMEDDEDDTLFEVGNIRSNNY